jgi:hypothetical protein
MIAGSGSAMSSIVGIPAGTSGIIEGGSQLAELVQTGSDLASFLKSKKKSNFEKEE